MVPLAHKMWRRARPAPEVKPVSDNAPSPQRTGELSVSAAPHGPGAQFSLRASDAIRSLVARSCGLGHPESEIDALRARDHDCELALAGQLE